MSFIPDLAMFRMTKLEGDIICMMRKRVIEMTCTIGKSIDVYFNDELIPEMTFLKYVEHYIGAGAEAEEKHPRFDRFYLTFCKLIIPLLVGFQICVLCRVYESW